MYCVFFSIEEVWSKNMFLIQILSEAFLLIFNEIFTIIQNILRQNLFMQPMKLFTPKCVEISCLNIKIQKVGKVLHLEEFPRNSLAASFSVLVLSLIQ